MLRGLRYLTVTCQDYRLQNILNESDELLVKLLNLLHGELSFVEKSETLWILTNLACEGHICYKLLAEMNIYIVISALFQDHFVKEHAVDLNEMELAFLEQLLWFTSNIVADSDKSKQDAFTFKLDKMLGIVLTSYHHQFKENIWKIFVWCMNTLSVGLGLLEVA